MGDGDPTNSADTSGLSATAVQPQATQTASGSPAWERRNLWTNLTLQDTYVDGSSTYKVQFRSSYELLQVKNDGDSKWDYYSIHMGALFSSTGNNRGGIALRTATIKIIPYIPSGKGYSSWSYSSTIDRAYDPNTSQNFEPCSQRTQQAYAEIGVEKGPVTGTIGVGAAWTDSVCEKWTIKVDLNRPGYMVNKWHWGADNFLHTLRSVALTVNFKLPQDAVPSWYNQNQIQYQPYHSGFFGREGDGPRRCMGDNC
jgi:hypothetical protein